MIRFVLLAVVFGPAVAPAADLSKQIDGRIDARLAELSLKAAPQADAVALHRRLHLDLLGRIPTPTETEAFLKANETPDAVADRLLAHPEFPVYWRKVLSGWLAAEQPGAAKGPGYPEFLAYLERGLGANKPWDAFARELIAPADTDDQKGAGYFLAVRLTGDRATQLDNVTTAVATSFFGVQLQCAKCHDHPAVKQWKQDHYYGLAAVFARLEKGDKGAGTVRDKVDPKKPPEVKFTTTAKVDRTAKPMFLDGTAFDPAADTRAALLKHAVSTDSPFFKRAVVNRAWKQLMGRGLVEPVDQMHRENPATHPELLVELADELAAGGFDLRKLLGGIVKSKAYRRSTVWAAPGTRPADDSYAVGILKPLTAQQMANAVAVATGYLDQLATKNAADTNGKPAPPGGFSPAIRARLEREREFDDLAARFEQTGDGFQATAGQALYLTFGPFVKKLRTASGGTLAEKLSKMKPDAAAKVAYLTVLARPATAEEVAEAEAFVKASKDAKTGVEELLWALLTSAEFRFAH